MPAARDESAESPSGGGSPLPALVVFALIAAASAIVIYRRRRLRSPEGAELQLRELLDALRATGREPPAGATLGTIGGRLSDSVGPSSARYASALRENRYGKRRRPRPGPAERRAFRWELARHSGAFGWWRVLRAMPPGGPRA